ncbi:MAG: hypothetical protein J1E31_06475 [Helicobacter sp.]|nr:hypothetical protein [Helicobacter sp.]
MFKFTPSGIITYLKFQKRQSETFFRKLKFKLFPSSYFKEALPNHYSFVLFTRAVSGWHASARFFSLCGLNCQTLCKDNAFYLNETKKFLERREDCCFLRLGVYRSYRSLKGDVGKLIPNSNILILVRDPISRCKAMLNHGTPNRSKVIRGSSFPIQNLTPPPTKP